MLGSDPPPPPRHGRKGSPSPNLPRGTATKEGEGGVGQMGFRAIPPPPKAIFFPPHHSWSMLALVPPSGNVASDGTGHRGPCKCTVIQSGALVLAWGYGGYRISEWKVPWASDPVARRRMSKTRDPGTPPAFLDEHSWSGYTGCLPSNTPLGSWRSSQWS